MMSKAAVIDAAQKRRGRLRPVHLPNVVEGQITELCRDLAVQAKRMRQLEEQADELRTVIRQWAGGAQADGPRRPTNRGGRR
jgi:hypothetical protein